ncbi:serine/threonine-protein kinase [Microbacterium sp. CFBP9034]|uniref:serine/threonine-protein kinase n=1 Tax=Microbacterium sp. CFBP9034 TaxID=3096540 RepID=UPI002A6B1C3A|nr:protein kinase [Microbacterium sp. CFBP9034]MDY0908539.1 protein kinase [Microbacterium sp. CFBP9034]
MSTPSTLIADRYRLVKMLGAGGMGVVWQAWDERLERQVALKMLRTQPELSESERQLATDRAMREARITAGLHHPHAVTVFDVVEHEGQPCIVMQLIDSTPLSVLLKEHGTLTPAETARIGAQVSSALAAAHKLRIVHRDVKPGNILIAEDGSARISDFGISHALGDATITATGIIHGTPAYLAPEAARGLPTTFASDVFSLGSTLYAMLEGDPPFGSDRNAIALLHKVARGGYRLPQHAGPLAPLLAEMLSPLPKRRPSMASVAASLSSLDERTDAPGAVPVDVPVVQESPDGDTEKASTADVATEPVEQDPPTPTTVAVTGPTEPPTAPRTVTAETMRVDQPTRYEAATAETEPLAREAASARAAGLASVSGPPPRSEPPGERPARRRRAGVIVGVLVLVGALIIGTVMLLNTLRPGVAPDAGPTVSQTPSATTVNEAPEADAGRPTTRTSSPPAEETPSPPPEEEEETPEPPLTPEQRVVDTISSYYSMLPGDLDSAWPRMTADYQENHAGGRGSYEAFWSAVAEVSIAEVIASAADRGQATLTYHFHDGRVVQEVTSFRLVDEGGVMKIAETGVLSSTQL